MPNPYKSNAHSFASLLSLIRDSIAYEVCVYVCTACVKITSVYLNTREEKQKKKNNNIIEDRPSSVWFSLSLFHSPSIIFFFFSKKKHFDCMSVSSSFILVCVSLAFSVFLSTYIHIIFWARIFVFRCAKRIRITTYVCMYQYTSVRLCTCVCVCRTTPFNF